MRFVFLGFFGFCLLIFALVYFCLFYVYMYAYVYLLAPSFLRLLSALFLCSLTTKTAKLSTLVLSSPATDLNFVQTATIMSKVVTIFSTILWFRNKLFMVSDPLAARACSHFTENAWKLIQQQRQEQSTRDLEHCLRRRTKQQSSRHHASQCYMGSFEPRRESLKVVLRQKSRKNPRSLAE